MKRQHTYPVKLCNELEVEVDIALVAVVDQLEEVIVGVIRVVQLDVHGGPLLSTHLLLLRKYWPYSSFEFQQLLSYSEPDLFLFFPVVRLVLRSDLLVCSINLRHCSVLFIRRVLV